MSLLLPDQIHIKYNTNPVTMQSLNLSRNELIKLRKKLPRNWAKVLSDRFGLSEGYIRHILIGNKIHDEVLHEAIKMAAKHCKEKTKNILLAKEVINGD